MKPNNQKNITLLVIILLANIFLFSYSLNLRSRWFGTLSSSPHDPTGHHQWLTGSTIVFAKNWINEGPFKLKFAMLENPLSVETVNNRSPYGSYPPGTIIPIYLISIISGLNPSPSMVMGYNLATHLIISLTLSYIVFYVLKSFKLDDTQAVTASIFPPLLQFLLPQTLYHHQNSYFSDQAVMLPFVLFLLLEILLFNSKNKKHKKIFYYTQLFVSFWGILTDWLFVFIFFATYIKRIIQNQISTKEKTPFLKESFSFWLPAISVISLFLIQVISIGATDVMKRRFIMRVGLNPDYADYQSNFINYIYSHLQSGYGKFAPHLMILSIILFVSWIFYANKSNLKLSNNQRNTLSSIFSIAILAPIIQLVVFRNHSAIHDFSVLKLSVLLSLIPFAILPALMSKIIKDVKNIKLRNTLNHQQHTIYPKILIILLAYTLLTHNRVRYFFPEPNYLMEDIGIFIHQNTGFNDIVFSEDISVAINPPQMLSYTMKRVYEAKTIAEIKDKLKNVSDDYTIVVLEQLPGVEDRQEIDALKQISYEKIEGENAILHFISKVTFNQIKFE